jgi:hypothetical protein
MGMDWDTILDNLPINTKPDTITALQYAREQFYDRGDNDCFYEGIELCNAIWWRDSDLVKICFVHDMEWIDVPDDAEIVVKWDKR